MPKHKLTLVLLFTTLFLFSNLALAQSKTNRASMSEDTDYLLNLYKHLHANPELSNEEHETSAFLQKQLAEFGYKVTTGVGGTGVVAIMKNGKGKKLMIRADMDALPVHEQTGLAYASKAKRMNRDGSEVYAMHACGHDVHMTTLIGTAKKMAKNKHKWQGTLMFILQPAEEIGAGAKAMIGDGLFSKYMKPDYNLALHVTPSAPAGQIAYSKGYSFANVDSVDIEVKGVGGHGAYPQSTKDPVVLAAQIVLALQTIVSREISALEPAVVTVGSIHGGTKHNVIGDNVHLQLTVRSYSAETRNKLISSIRRIAAGQAIAAGMPEELMPVVVHQEDEFTPAAYNHPDLTDSVVSNLRNLLGADNVTERDPVMGGEDFGRYGSTTEKIPSFMFWLGTIGEDRWKQMQKGKLPILSLHSPYYYPDPEPTIETGVKAMVSSALHLLAGQ